MRRKARIKVVDFITYKKNDKKSLFESLEGILW
jgi:hypothetical protein